jgi:hypothetical protein
MGRHSSRSWRGAKHPSLLLFSLERCWEIPERTEKHRYLESTGWMWEKILLQPGGERRPPEGGSLKADVFGLSGRGDDPKVPCSKCWRQWPHWVAEILETKVLSEFICPPLCSLLLAIGLISYLFLCVLNL